MAAEKFSQINLPVSVEIETIRKAVNQLIDDAFQRSDFKVATNDKTLRIKAEKTKEIALTFGHSRIGYTLPLKIHIKKFMPATALEVEATGEILLNLSSEISIEPDWKLSTQTAITEFSWLEKPVLRVGLFGLPVKLVVNTILRKRKKRLCAAIDTELAKIIDLQSYVNKAWLALQSQLVLHDTFHAWLKIRPKSMGMSPLNAVGKFIKSTISMKAMIQIVLGEKPALQSPAPLPLFSQFAEAGEDFSLHLDALIGFREAEIIVKKFLAGKSFSKYMMTAQVIDVKLKGEDKNIIAELLLDGSFNGWVLLKIAPFLEKEKNEQGCKLLDYTLNTRSLTWRLIDWLTHQMIEKKLEKQLRSMLENTTPAIMTQIRQRLKNFEITDHVFLHGELDHLKVENPEVKAERLEVTVKAVGSLNLYITKFELEGITPQDQD